MKHEDSHDTEVIKGLITRLNALEEAAQPLLPSLIPDLRSQLRCERVLIYGVTLEPDGFALDFAHSSGFHLPHDEVSRVITAGLQRTKGEPWALFDPRNPSVQQRNVVLHIPPPAMLAGARGNELFRRLLVPDSERPRLVARMRALNDGLLRRIGMNDMNRYRVLLCEGPSLLASLNAARTERFTERERAILERLTPVLVGRLRLERKIALARFQVAALPVALEAVAAEALILDRAGVIQHANSAARGLSPGELRALQREFGSGTRARNTGEYEIRPILAPGMPPYFLAIRRRQHSDATVRLQIAAARWNLTRRQTEVLARLVRGESTASIAAELHCASRTVEAHLTRVLINAGVESRAALIARFWTL